ncbi:unnamed protein product [Rangifer tarandus platyrhynchus]|uniref:Uncharacterized protein n=1 Tax=Rangifer tarandus platyrhynchus TaxID=3082113 RepID=A0ABN8ZIA6_RANTA|nr:unnamed protein product [Rangifer tarandus platyrhynchus]
MRQCCQDAGPVSSGALAALGGIYPFTPGYQSNSQILAALFLRRPEAPPSGNPPPRPRQACRLASSTRVSPGESASVPFSMVNATFRDTEMMYFLQTLSSF